MPEAGSRLRVAELAEGIAGPTCGRLFAALGHDVVKLEAQHGDRLRASAVEDPDEAALLAATFAHLNAGKRSVVASTRQRAEILAGADLVITDRPRAEWPALGIDAADTVVALRPRGLADDQGEVNDSLLAEAFGGLAHMIGEPDGPPLSLGGEQTAHAAGFTAFLGAMLALARGERGEVVDVALADVAAYMDWKSDIALTTDGVAPRRTGSRRGRWRLLRAHDSWIGVIFQPAQWPELVDLVDDDRLRAPRLADLATRDAEEDLWWPVVEEWVASRAGQEIYSAAQARGLAFGVALDVGDLRDSPQYVDRGFIRRGPAGASFGPLLSATGITWTDGPAPELGSTSAAAVARSWAVPTAERTRRMAPLAGMVVLDLGTITAGAATGRLLADYGASVIKIESPSRPDPFRYWGLAGSPEGGGSEAISAVFESNNAGKYALALDLKKDEDRAEFYRLVRRADVVLENFRVGVTARLGVDYPTLAALNPDLVYLSLSSQGQFGPESGFSSYGSTLDLLSGLASVTGDAGGPPTWSSVDVNYPDQLVSLIGAGLVVHSWLFDQAGDLDVSQREIVSWTLAGELGLLERRGVLAGRTGSRRAGSHPHEIYRCRGSDEWLAVACFDDVQRAALRTLIGLDDADELDTGLRVWAASHRLDDAETLLAAARVPCSRVLDAAGRRASEHFARRRVFLAEPVRRKGFPLVLEGWTPPTPSVAPRVGEHDEVVRGGDPRTLSSKILSNII